MLNPVNPPIGCAVSSPPQVLGWEPHVVGPWGCIATTWSIFSLPKQRPWLIWADMTHWYYTYVLYCIIYIYIYIIIYTYISRYVDIYIDADGDAKSPVVSQTLGVFEVVWILQVSTSHSPWDHSKNMKQPKLDAWKHGSIVFQSRNFSHKVAIEHATPAAFSRGRWHRCWTSRRIPAALWRRELRGNGTMLGSFTNNKQINIQ